MPHRHTQQRIVIYAAKKAASAVRRPKAVHRPKAALNSCKTATPARGGEVGYTVVAVESPALPEPGAVRSQLAEHLGPDGRVVGSYRFVLCHVGVIVLYDGSYIRRS